MELDENYTKHCKEYVELEKLHPSSKNKEIIHRKKILKEWIDNELDKWKNRHD